MSLAITNVAASAIYRVAESGRNPFARLRAWMETRRHYREDLRELRSMDARMLDDIGIAREQVQYLAQQPYAGDWSGALFLGRRR